MSSKSKPGTLSDKISELLTSAPKSFDPEDDVHEETVAKVVDQEDEYNDEIEVSTSKFRTQNIDLLEDVDKRYVGKKSSRKDLVDSEDEVESEGDEMFSEFDESKGSNDDSDEEFEDEQSNSEMEDDEKDSGEEDKVNEVEANFQHISGITYKL